MLISCLDLEGVLVPEIWIEVSKKTGIRELRFTTRDIPDYDVLMRQRLKILKAHKISLKDIQKVIQKIKPLPGAKNFLDNLRAHGQVVILSDTFQEFAKPLMRQLGWPGIFCNYLEIDNRGFISNYRLRQSNGKEKAVRALQSLDFQVHAAGDSYNDITMLKTADRGILFNPPSAIEKKFKSFAVTRTYSQLFKKLTQE